MRAQTRHQLKQDAFSRATIGVAEKTADWTVEHRNTIIIATIAAIIVIGAAVGGWYYLSGQDEKASLDLSVAVRTMDTQLRAPGTRSNLTSPPLPRQKIAPRPPRSNFRPSSTSIPIPAPRTWPTISWQ